METIEFGPGLVAVLMAFVGVLSALVTGLVAAIPAILTYRQGVANKNSQDETKEVVKAIHKDVNSTAAALAAKAVEDEKKMLAVTSELAQLKGETGKK